MRYHLTPVRMVITKNLQIINAGEGVDKRVYNPPNQSPAFYHSPHNLLCSTTLTFCCSTIMLPVGEHLLFFAVAFLFAGMLISQCHKNRLLLFIPVEVQRSLLQSSLPLNILSNVVSPCATSITYTYFLHSTYHY